jgi:hypothetical protein
MENNILSKEGALDKLTSISQPQSPTKVEEVNPKLDLSDVYPIDDANDFYKPEGVVVNADDIKILEIFSPDEVTIAGGGTYKMECPDCGLQGSRTLGFILFPETNSAYCQSSHKWFQLLEAYALKKKLIRCMEGREKGEGSTRKVLAGELWTLTLEEFKNEYGNEIYNRLAEQFHIKKKIEIPGNNRYASDFADDLADIYKSRNVLFRRAETGNIIKIDRNSEVGEDGESMIETGFVEMEDNAFVTYAEMFTKPWARVFTKTGQEMIVNKSMTQNHAGLVLSSENFKYKLPAIHRMFKIQMPLLHKKTFTTCKKGYDKRFGSWLPFGAPQIKKDMYNLEDAKELIEYIFSEFCFASEKDRMHAIAGFITPFCRGMFDGNDRFSVRTPVFVYMANRERAGKDFCANCSGMLYEGMAEEQPPICNDEKGSSNMNDELRKKITACMVEGKKRFHSSNNKGVMNNSVFEMAITDKVWTDRVLGKTKTVTYNNEMDYSMSGNMGIRLTADMSNRARIINLHLADEDANARRFKNPRLHEYIRERRVFIISALYTIIENWVKKGMQPGSVPFTSFPEWARVVGGIMEAAGWMSPCTRDTVQVISLDPETEDMKALFELCHSKYPNKWMDGKMVATEAETVMSDLDFNLKGDKIKFGMRLDRFIGRIEGDILLKIDSKDKRSDKRKYMFWKDPTLVEKGEPGELREPSIVVGFSLKESIGNRDNLPRFPRFPDSESNNSNSISLSDDLTKDLKSHKYVDQLLLQPKGLETDKKSSEENVVKDKHFKTAEYFDKIGKDYLRKEFEMQRKPKKKKKEKTTRELQFWEDPQCADIVKECTKEQVLEYVKNNPNSTYQQIDTALGIGVMHWLIELDEEGLVTKNDIGWEIINAI